LIERGPRLKTLATVVEIVGGVAVIVSLIFVGLEVRQNTEASQAATYQEMIRASNEYLLAIGTDPDLSLVMYRAATDSLRSRLSGVDWLQYGTVRWAFWRNMENAFVQHDRGVLADPEWEVYRQLACDGLRSEVPGVWEGTKRFLRSQFVTMLEECK